MKTSKFKATSTADEVTEGLDLQGVRIIVTGGGSGIGIETCLALAKKGADVTIGLRNSEQGDKAVETIISQSKNSNVRWSFLDLSDFSSVRNFATTWGDKSLNVLINNAGVMACPPMKTKDGLEMQIGTNHFGHFLLTVLLLPNLRKGFIESGKPSRVVSLSSIGHRISPVDFNDIHFEKREYNKWTSYGQSKTANVLFAVALDKKFKDFGIRAFAVHPGGIMTELQRHLPKEEMVAMGWMDQDGNLNKMMKTPQQGASTSVWAAVSPDLNGAGGIYLENCQQAQPFSESIPKFSGVYPHALDEAQAERLWEISMTTVNVAEPKL